MKEENKNIKPVKGFEPNLNGKEPSHVSTQLSAQRTGLAFQRTRIATDRTLMSVIRTALSLISFGFTIFQFFHHIKTSIMEHRPNSPKVFGLSLVSLGILLLLFGISYHLRLMYQIRQERTLLAELGLIPKQDTFPVSMALIGAMLLLILGIVSITTMYLQYHHH